MQRTVKTEYPLVFVHGMFGWGQNEGINKKAPYWGATSGSITDFLSDGGIECYAASVGPMSSAWDQACELYAQLTGTRVDYGEAHSKKHGHKRYGRTYEKPLFDGWSADKKIHLIGHSFGGNAGRMLVHLLTYGAAEETDACDDASALFYGRKENFVCSLTAICSPLDGTKAYETASKYKLIQPLKFIAYNYAGVFGRIALGHKFSDFHLEQFGFTDSPESKTNEPFVEAIKKLFVTKDCIAYDMYAEGSKELNKRIHISPSVYYFSDPFNAVDAEKSKPTNTDFIFMKATSLLMLHDCKKNGKPIIGNDGLVDVESAKHPSTEPFKEYDKADIKSGMWNVMPVSIGDHGTPIGLFADKNETRSFYDNHILLLSETEKKSAEASFL